LLLAFGLPVVVALAVYGVDRVALSKGPAQGAEATPAGVAQEVGQDKPPVDKPAEKKDDDPKPRRRTIEAPELEGGVGWLNAAGPITIHKDLRGKIVLLDFWTFCCINCIHTLPDLARLEKKFANQLVVIGVHSAKFTNERDTEKIRKAILRYEISHPVVNDANMQIWRRYAVNSWPTLALIDPEGNYVGSASGEGLYDVVDSAVTELVKIHRSKKTLNEEPLRFDLARFRERGDSPLFFPGKILADAAGRRLFIADSTHHRIVITDLDGKKIAIAGTGEPSKNDGPFDKAGFNDPQGLALAGDVLYVADRKNHLIRALHLKNRMVSTVAGSGEKGEDRLRGGPAHKVGLNSPWDVLLHGNKLFIAMAGHHQIWTLDLDKRLLSPYAGNGYERIVDGPLEDASFAQPSGLASDGTTLYVADSEVSAVRALPLGGKGEVRSIVGEGLFEFGDEDGVGRDVRLQHALGLAFHDGKLYLADTYNSKLKIIDPAKQSCTTYLGGKGSGWFTGALFNDPGGLSIAGDRIYVADTNNHRIRVVDLKTKAVSTLTLKGVEAPKSAREPERPSFGNATHITLPVATVAGDGDWKLKVDLQLTPGAKLAPETKMTYVVETLPDAKTPWSETRNLDQTKPSLEITVPAARVAEAKGIRLSLVYYESSEGSSGVSKVKSHVWDIPVKIDPGSMNRLIRVEAPAVAKNGGKTE
jgi:thiol-disulfide isomerase/thioredoxin